MIDVNEETKSGEGTTYVSLLTSGVIASDIRIMSVKNLTMFNLRDASNTHQKLKTLHHLVGKVNVKVWFYHKKSTMSIDRTLIFCRLFPPKLYKLDIKSYGPPKQSLLSWSGFHAVLSYKFEEPSPLTTTGCNTVARGIPTDANTIYTGLKVTEVQMK